MQEVDIIAILMGFYVCVGSNAIEARKYSKRCSGKQPGSNPHPQPCLSTLGIILARSEEDLAGAMEYGSRGL